LPHGGLPLQGSGAAKENRVSRTGPPFGDWRACRTRGKIPRRGPWRRAVARVLLLLLPVRPGSVGFLTSLSSVNRCLRTCARGRGQTAMGVRPRCSSVAPGAGRPRGLGLVVVAARGRAGCLTPAVRHPVSVTMCLTPCAKRGAGRVYSRGGGGGGGALETQARRLRYGRSGTRIAPPHGNPPREVCAVASGLRRQRRQFDA